MSGELQGGYYVRPATADGVWKELHLIVRPKRVRIDALRELYWPDDSRPAHVHFSVAGIHTIRWPELVMSHDRFRREYSDYEFDPHGMKWIGDIYRAVYAEHKWRKDVLAERRQ